ncbi:hypothetical protein BDQ17DRAFT_901706 [Cyathus striatus]|nr:hypothetical protein BDQ17DRAFT_901706 [Cyathus striatus]
MLKSPSFFLVCQCFCPSCCSRYCCYSRSHSSPVTSSASDVYNSCHAVILQCCMAEASRFNPPGSCITCAHVYLRVISFLFASSFPCFFLLNCMCIYTYNNPVLHTFMTTYL